MTDDDFEALFTVESAATIVKLEQINHRALCAAYSAVLVRSRAELIALLQGDGTLAEQAPELIEWLGKLERVSKREETFALVNEAHRRLSIALDEVARGRRLH